MTVYNNFELVITHENSASLIQELLKELPPQPVIEGKGIVVCAGGRYLPSFYAQVRLLREFGCTLPITCYYNGAAELGEDFSELLVGYGVTFVDLSVVNAESPYRQRDCHGWSMKSAAVINAPYREVLLLDADNFPARDPSYLFDTCEYQEYGYCLWPDIRPFDPNAQYWASLGLPAEDVSEHESGQLLIDKFLAWDALAVTSWLNGNSNYYYTVAYGDKDYWRAGARLTGKDFFVSHPCFVIPGTLVQRDFKGEALFYHRIVHKLDRFAPMAQVDGFVNEDKLAAYLEDLKRDWLPNNFNLTAAERAATNALVGKRYHYYRVGLDDRDFVFGANHVITEGAAGAERYYFIRNDKLCISGDAGVICELEPFVDGWVGRWVSHEKCLIILEDR